MDRFWSLFSQAITSVCFLSSQNDAVNQQLTSIFTHCYGNGPIPSIPEIKRTPPARLGM